MSARFIVGIAIILTASAGCVSQGTHNQVLRELQATQGDLDRLRIQNDALNKQIAGLKDAQAKLKEEHDKANAQIAVLNDAVVKERQAGENKLKDLDRQVKELTAAKKSLIQERDVAMQRYEDSLRIQKRQAKELKEREQAALLQPPTPSPKPPAPSPTAPAAPEPPAPAPAEPPPPTNGSVAATPKPPTPPTPAPALVDINHATPADLAGLELGKEDSDKLIKNRPYKTKEELITRAGIAKTTVDKIRDRITVSQ